MSDPNAKKDEHHAEKKGFGSTLADVGVKVVLVLVFLYFLGAVIPLVFAAAGDLLGYTGNVIMTTLKEGFKTFLAAVRSFAFDVVNAVIFVLIGYLFFKAMKDWLFPAKKEDEHH